MMVWYTAEGEEEWTEQDQVSLQSTFAFDIIMFFLKVIITGFNSLIIT